MKNVFSTALGAFFCLVLASATAATDDTQPPSGCPTSIAAGQESAFEMSQTQLEDFFKKAFALPQLPKSAHVVLMTDLPARRSELTGNWEDRLALAHRWAKLTQRIFSEGTVNLLYYANVGGHNGPLPKQGWLRDDFSHGPIFSIEEAEVAAEGSGDKSPTLFNSVLADWLSDAQLVLSLPKYSATAPLSDFSVQKPAPFKAISIPGFNSALLPIFGSDYGRIASRISQLTPYVDAAQSAEITFAIKGAALRQEGVEATYNLSLDLRDRQSRAEPTISTFWPWPGERALDNAPIGELWVVPVEGSRSQSQGFLPVQIRNELVVFEVKQNRLHRVLTHGPYSQSEAARIQDRGYSNLGELGFGVLSSLGFSPLSSENDAATLVNEKLTLHIARGLSAHLGGTVDESAFSLMAPVHIDAVYLPQMQPMISISEVTLHFPSSPAVTIMRDDQYVIFGQNVP